MFCNFDIWLMSRLRLLSCLHFCNMKGEISLSKLSEIISVLRFGQCSKPPCIAAILFIEMSRCTRRAYGAKGFTTSTSPSYSFFTSIWRLISPSVAFSSNAYPNAQSDGIAPPWLEPFATLNSSNSSTFFGRVFWIAAKVNWQSLTNC